MFVYTTAIKKIRAMVRRKKVIQGGTSAGKTYAVIPILIDRACKTPGLKITIVAETIASVKDGAADIFKSIMKDTNRWREDGWIGSPMEYTFANGSKIQFKAFDDEGKAKAAGKRDILFINEANHVDYAIADALMIRSKETYLDFNADVEFWAHTEVLTEVNEYGLQVSELLILTYLDNEALPEETREDLMVKKSKAYHNPNGDLDSKDNIKSEYWYNWCKVYLRGLIGNISALRIMPLLNKCKEVPVNAVAIPSGLDFGFFPDPTCFCQLWIRPKKLTGKLNDELYIKQVVYDTKLSIDSASVDSKNLCSILVQRGINPSSHIIAESADSRAINDMRNAGFSIEAVRKSSVEQSIRLFHDYDIYFVIPDPLNTEKDHEAYFEFDNYRYAVDRKTKNILGYPADKQKDHSCDAVRYVLMSRDFRWSVQ